MEKIKFMLLTAIMSTVMFSCERGWEDEPQYMSDVDIVGCWEAYCANEGYGEYDIRGIDKDRYEFYSDGTGQYTYYSIYGFVYYYFDWETRSNGTVKIWYDDGDCDVFYYSFNSYDDLILSDSRNFHRYMVYRYAGFYYNKEKTLDTDAVAGKDKTLDEDMSQSGHERPAALKSIKQKKD